MIPNAACGAAPPAQPRPRLAYIEGVGGVGGAGEARGLAGLEGSYLSLDGEGRVVRLDSFAKALAPGLRLGWATGAPAIIDKLASCIHGSALGPCATTQAPPPPPFSSPLPHFEPRQPSGARYLQELQLTTNTLRVAIIHTDSVSW